MSKTIFVSNRLPITVVKENDQIHYHLSIGGLATGLNGYHEKKDSIWVGWPGITADLLTHQEKKEIDQKLKTEYRFSPLFLSEGDLKLYYEGYANKTIWPLFHYFTEMTEYHRDMWKKYQEVNQMFYQNIKKYIKKDSVIWIHDYQLMLLPKMIRDHHPTVKIGFFLHIPFPSYEVFRLLIEKNDVIEGILGADLIGFHTYDYVRHFISSVRRILDVNQRFHQFDYQDRKIQVDAFPMGIDYQYFFNAGKEIKKQKTDEKIILSVDRLDYTKGIIERLKGYRTFLERYPKYVGKVRLHLIVAPSRDKLKRYDELHHEIETVVSQINGQFGNFKWMPIWYVYKSFEQKDLLIYYQQSDILLVTPLRDGMNLIAKEYIASRSDYQGMLIISETAGAASELHEALIVNANDSIQIARTIKTALEMRKEEMMRRNHSMHERIKQYDVHFWSEDFLGRLNSIEQSKDKELRSIIKDKMTSNYKVADKRLFLLDYDGTLAPFKKVPAQAMPSKSLKRLLATLAEDEKNELVIVSGRDYRTLDKWFDKMPIHLVGNHGLYYKKIGEKWQTLLTVNDDWKITIQGIFRKYADRMPGAFVEEKSGSIEIHYRASEPEMAAIKIAELKDALLLLTSQTFLEIKEGHKVLEVKDSRVNKGFGAALFTETDMYDFIFIAGDDQTDEDMFNIAPNAYSIKVGHGYSHANYRVSNITELLDILKVLSQY